MKLTWNPPQIRSSKAVIAANTPYAVNVHFGGDARPDGTKTPGRPWMDAAVGETEFLEEFKTSVEGCSPQEIEHAFQVMIRVLFQNVKNQLLLERWKWDRLTYRSTGEVAGTTRDIYDTGTLYRSHSLEFF